MTKQINVTDALYSRLAKHAKGFDTPEQVIERMIDFYEEHEGVTTRSEVKTPVILQPKIQPKSFHIDIKYYPDDENEFKKQFLVQKHAWIIIHKVDGSVTEHVWNLNGFTENSSVKGNLLSGRLRGWKEKGICKAEIAINKDDIK